MIVRSGRGKKGQNTNKISLKAPPFSISFGGDELVGTISHGLAIKQLPETLERFESGAQEVHDEADSHMRGVPLERSYDAQSRALLGPTLLPTSTGNPSPVGSPPR